MLLSSGDSDLHSWISCRLDVGFSVACNMGMDVCSDVGRSDARIVALVHINAMIRGCSASGVPCGFILFWDFCCGRTGGEFRM